MNLTLSSRGYSSVDNMCKKSEINPHPDRKPNSRLFDPSPRDTSAAANETDNSSKKTKGASSDGKVLLPCHAMP